VLVAFLRLAAPLEYDAQLQASAEAVATPKAFVEALIQRTWAQRRGMQHELQALLFHEDGEDCLATVDGRLALRTFVRKYSSVHEQEEFGANLGQFSDSESLLEWRDQALQASSSESEGEEPVPSKREPPARPMTRRIAKQAPSARSAQSSKSQKKAKAGKKRR